MFGDPTRNACALVAPNCRFLNNDAYRCMVSRNGRFPKILKYMRKALEIASFSHWETDKRPFNSGQCSYCAVGCRVSPCKVGLSDFEDMRKRRVEEGSLSRISVCEGLVPNFESSFLWLANTEVLCNHTNGFRVEWPVRSEEP